MIGEIVSGDEAFAGEGNMSPLTAPDETVPRAAAPTAGPKP